MKKSLGVALGGGGAKGLAHIAILETIDELGFEVSTLSGTSVGAVVGVLYAAGLRGEDIREAFQGWLKMPGSILEARSAKRTFGWLELVSLEVGKSHLFHAEPLLEEITNLIGAKTFEELKIPFKVVAASFWERREVVIDSGPLIPALSASFCLPGIFKPVELDGRILVDGGCVNPVPFDLIHDECDVVVAVDVLGNKLPELDGQLPTYLEGIFNTFQIAEKTIAIEKMKTHPPDIYLEPDIRDVRVLEFNKSEQVYEQTRIERERLASELPALMAEDSDRESTGGSNQNASEVLR
jgi:NTE family protein